ncbi:MAG: flippase-like domain-containing protein [archaeon]
MAPSEPKFITNLKRNLFLMLVGFVVLIIVLKFIGYGEIFRTIAMINIWFILLMFGTKVLSALMFNYKVYLLSKNLKPISFWKLLPIHLAGSLVNQLTPGPSVGGEPLKAYYLEKATGYRGSICLGLYAMDSLIFMVGSAIFMIFSTLFLVWSIQLEKLRYILLGWFAIALVFAIFVVLFVFKLSKNKDRFNNFLKRVYKFPLFKFLRKHFSSAEDFVRKLHSKRKAFITTLKHLSKDRKTLFYVLVVSILWYPLQAFGMWLLFVGMGIQVPFLRLMAVTTVSMSLGFLIFVPGGTGAYESAVILLMTMLGVSAKVITAAVILDRAGYYLLTYVVGYLALSYVTMIYASADRMYTRLETKL